LINKLNKGCIISKLEINSIGPLIFKFRMCSSTDTLMTATTRSILLMYFQTKATNFSNIKNASNNLNSLNTRVAIKCRSHSSTKV